VIERMGAELGVVPGLRAEIEALKDHITRAEADRAARLEVIERQGAELGRIPGLQADIDYLTAEVTAARAQTQSLTARLAAADAEGSAAREALERKDQEANRLVKDAAEKDARIASLETALRRRSGWRRFWPWS
jgi:chromosome segregation ATPase